MATLIPEINIEDFLKLSDDERKKLKSCEIVGEGSKYLFTFINPQTDFIRSQAENMAQLSNSVGGRDLKEV